MNIGDKVKVCWPSYKECDQIGILDRYIESYDEPGYWLINEDGEEFEVLFQDLFRGDAELTVIE
jgi:hypothetical protein